MDCSTAQWVGKVNICAYKCQTLDVLPTPKAIHISFAQLSCHNANSWGWGTSLEYKKINTCYYLEQTNVAGDNAPEPSHLEAQKIMERAHNIMLHVHSCVQTVQIQPPQKMKVHAF
eukprot:6465808-Amphidinium_carterae.1